MRIIAGKHRGRKLFVPKGLHTRPTTDMLREAVFNILGSTMVDRRVLDLFAGTGALGLEAMSRGAREAVFVDKRNTCLVTINRNIQTLGLTGQCRVLKIDLARSLGRLKNEIDPFDLIFMDPPYAVDLVEKTLTRLFDSRLAGAGAVAVAEHSSKLNLTGSVENWRLLETRKYGHSALSFFAFTDIEAE
ncbi:MAG: 16S rRNA (guanine(966)-N(2))-methyltransferase RsmD [Deltaproteobacteria bacterium]|nr:16S rRNA (guanine(966)-N(2))-methyltransferase RsmD [Deltaproteobacteria bacterium]